VGFATDRSAADVKREVVDRIESELGRTRTGDKYAPRTIDIDIVMDSGEALNLELWNHAFVVLPMSDCCLAPPADGAPANRRGGQSTGVDVDTSTRNHAEIVTDQLELDPQPFAPR
jgi:hypothetical protein